MLCCHVRLFASEIWGRWGIMGFILFIYCDKIHAYRVWSYGWYFVLKIENKEAKWGMVCSLPTVSYIYIISYCIRIDIIIKNQEIIFLKNTIIFFKHCTIGDEVPVSVFLILSPLHTKSIHYIISCHFYIQQCSQNLPKTKWIIMFILFESAQYWIISISKRYILYNTFLFLCLLSRIICIFSQILYCQWCLENREQMDFTRV